VRIAVTTADIPVPFTDILFILRAVYIGMDSQSIPSTHQVEAMDSQSIPSIHQVGAMDSQSIPSIHQVGAMDSQSIPSIHQVGAMDSPYIPAGNSRVMNNRYFVIKCLCNLRQR
jgi:hypothetical protein